ncbi:MAG TPA: hypothetical protein VFS40_02280 [Gemmatimonadales bacterium]|nr:hypothetical protein [Gemmatimonadales bacterium]
MIPLLLAAGAAALLLQVPAVQRRPPTVGDTLWLTRALVVPPGRTVRAAEWQLGGGGAGAGAGGNAAGGADTSAVELLGKPQVVVRGDSAFVRYPAVAWRPGRHTLTVPGPLLLAASGDVDSLAPASLTIEVTSVLPAAVPDSQIPLQPPAGIVPRLERSPLPLLVLLGLAAVLLAPIWWWWRRRGRATAVPPAIATPATVPVARWEEAGEYHAIAAAAAGRLRRWIERRVPEAHRGLDTHALLLVLTERRPDWPQAAVGRILRALDEAQFAPAPPTEAARLAADAERLEGRLGELERAREAAEAAEAGPPAAGTAAATTEAA